MKVYALSDLRFISPSTLRSWLARKSDPNHGRLAIVDVRDSDYFGGHIKGCYHYPAGNFHETLPELRQKLVDDKVQDVVFHCALSQVRGPKSALRFLRSIEELGAEEKKKFDGMNVCVLKGGFTSWQQEYGTDKEVTEDYVKDLWE
ncbi:hypothetical protein PUMCH_000074 [Australozyma saopauloensis]|uniref:Rhodanese domain-containing protein n=1 Tax=Australozyma saopauloensis TaxID=291208 RepID=A0AAX4H2R1_9ASCO|nr:hypothetical protein PUMCH_000074 [[Candida] saopauloensis]